MVDALKRVARFFCNGIDPAALGVARFLYGMMVLIDLFEERGMGRVAHAYGDPDLCHFPLFNNYPILPVDWMFMLYAFLMLCATCLMLGFAFKPAIVGFSTGYWYLFFLNKQTWNNHSYLYGLLSILWFFSNANYYWSVDGLIWPSIRNKKVPRWNYSIIQFQLFLLYFFAGIKKLDADWRSGYSMTGLGRAWVFDPFRLVLSDEHIDLFMVHGFGLAFDMFEGFLLYFDKTRPIGYLMAYSFHSMNIFLFSIGMFSWMCMAMLPIFSNPRWPKKLAARFPLFARKFLPLTDEPRENSLCSDVTHTCISEAIFGVPTPMEDDNDGKDSNVASSEEKYLRSGPSISPVKNLKKKEEKQEKDEKDQIKEEKKSKKKKKTKEWQLTLHQMGIYTVLLSYVSTQLFLPFSHSITKGYNSWTNGLYGYSWDMMIHSWNTQHTVIKIVDVDGRTEYIRPGAFTYSKSRVFSHPDMSKQYAVCLKKSLLEIPELNLKDPKIYFDSWTSLNKRYQQRRIDPRVDLSTAPWHPFKQTEWLLPLLVELSPWRERLDDIKRTTREKDNMTDVIFVADFPGMHLENFIEADIEANVTVLSGKVEVEFNGRNTSVGVNETVRVPSNTTHFVHTVSAMPSSYMYLSYNRTWVNMTEPDHEKDSPNYKDAKEKRKRWSEMSFTEKFHHQFERTVTRRLTHYRNSLYMIYFAACNILDIPLPMPPEEERPGSEDDGAQNKQEL